MKMSRNLVAIVMAVLMIVSFAGPATAAGARDASQRAERLCSNFGGYFEYEFYGPSTWTCYGPGLSGKYVTGPYGDVYWLPETRFVRALGAQCPGELHVGYDTPGGDYFPFAVFCGK
jgi:hypothetical protein